MRLLFHNLATVLKLSVMRWSLDARWRAFTRWQALQPRAETQWAVQLRAGQTALEAGASFDEVEQLLITNGGGQAPPARATAIELFRPPSPQPPSLRTTAAAVDERPPSMRSPPPAQSQPRSAHEQPQSRTVLLACRASPNRRRPARVRRRSSERLGESSAASRAASPLGGGHEMETYLRSLSDQARAMHANAPLAPV